MVVWSVLACTPSPDVLHIDPVPGNPLVTRAPLYPWPSDLFLVDDPTTATGRRIDIDADLLPEGVPPEIIADDGFTRAPAILAWFDGGIDPATLPDLAGSVAPGSSAMLVRQGDFDPVPILAEIDANVADPTQAALILRPQHTLDPDTGYVVILTDGLETIAGDVPPVNDAFRALRDGLPTDDPTVEGMRPGFAPVTEALAAHQIAPESVVLAWTFHTRSESGVVDLALHLQDAVSTGEVGDWTLTSDVVEDDNRVITGTFTTPDFLDAEGGFVLDQGLPVQQGSREVEFLLTIPVTVTEARPVVLFGHGFFSAKEEITWSSLQHSLQPWAMSAASVDFIGFNEADTVASAPALAGDLVALRRVIHQQLQSHTHFTALARLIEAHGAEIVEDRGAGAFSPLDPDRIEYMGISNGGTQGAVILATSPVIDRGALVVPGGAWAHMLQRAVQWSDLGGLFELRYPDPVDLQLVLSIVQHLFDPVDTVNFARGLVTQPFDGRGPNQVTLHMAVEDSQVSNMVTEWIARDAGLPIVEPSGRQAYGLDGIELPPPGRTDVAGALFVYDEGYPAQPTTNTPPSEDNGSHESIRYLPAYTEQVGAFLEDGTLVQVCDGACDPD